MLLINKQTYILLILVFSISFASAQSDTLIDLTMNNSVRAFYNSSIGDPNSPYNKKTINKALLTLPFIDDFSQNFIFPDANLWQDMHAYVNSNFPENPITYGVATLDGLDSTGMPYNFSLPTSYGIADYLTSQQIDLTTPIDSVFMSFYYQPQGNGNKPETKDSLRLEFFRQSDSTWVRMWGTPGVANHAFLQVMIPIDTSFHNNEFQFRFVNWATLSGNVDHWNLDYIYIDENRNYADTALREVSFITNHHTLLNDYTAMPWDHYLTDTIGLMKPTVDVTYKNNHSLPISVTYKIQVIDNNGAGPATGAPYPFAASSRSVAAYSDSIVPLEIASVPHVYNFPADFGAQTKVFQIKNYFDISPNDSLLKNDTVNSYQVFGSYYAYDDGSAEGGYGVQGIGSKLGHEFLIRKDDTLTAFQIYFNPIMNNLSAETFRLKVWSSLNPEVEIYSQAATLFTSPIYSNTNQFLNYNLDVPLYLNAGTYYFGWEKISANFLNVGWDVNTNNNTKVHYNSVGVWQTASFDGSLMLRPVFGTDADPQVSVEENEVLLEDFEVYPNPTSDAFYFKSNNTNNYSYHIQLLDLSGKTITETESSLSNKIDVSNISNGIYFIRFSNNETGSTLVKKVIISK